LIRINACFWLGIFSFIFFIQNNSRYKSVESGEKGIRLNIHYYLTKNSKSQKYIKRKSPVYFCSQDSRVIFVLIGFLLHLFQIHISFFFIINQIYLEFLTRKEADEKTIMEIKFCLWFLPRNGNRRPNHWLTWNLPNRIGLVLQGACIMLQYVWDAQCNRLWYGNMF